MVVDIGVVEVVGGTAEVVATGAPVVGGTTDVLEPERATVLVVTCAFVVLVDAAFVAEHAPRSTHGKADAMTAKPDRAVPWLRSPAAKGLRS